MALPLTPHLVVYQGEHHVAVAALSQAGAQHHGPQVAGHGDLIGPLQRLPEHVAAENLQNEYQKHDDEAGHGNVDLHDVPQDQRAFLECLHMRPPSNIIPQGRDGARQPSLLRKLF